MFGSSTRGFVAADTLFLALNERASNPNPNDLVFPLIQGILTFDTPYNGLSRSMFVYGAFSNYQKVSGVFNAMSALAVAAPATLSRVGAQRAPTTAVSTSRGPQWQAWQMLALRTGTIGAIAAGGVVAYMHRETMMNSVMNARNLSREDISKGYEQSVESLGQGLAYINRDNVGKSFAWLSDHFTFVGSLMKQKELNRRLERMGALKGVGMRDYYASLGENGYWSGGYFVPERTFCAVPEKDHAAYPLFSRRVFLEASDEVQAHLHMFIPEKHPGYEKMVDESASLVKEWFTSEASIVDDPKLQIESADEAAEKKAVDQALKEGDKGPSALSNTEDSDAKNGENLPDQSPIDIAAAASLVGDSIKASGSINDAISDKQRSYAQYLFQVAQQAGVGAKDWLPETVPSIPNMPTIPSSVSSWGQMSLPKMNIFSSKKEADTQKEADPQKEADTQQEADPEMVADAQKEAVKTEDAPADAEADKSEEAPDAKEVTEKAPDAKEVTEKVTDAKEVAKTEEAPAENKEATTTQVSETS